MPSLSAELRARTAPLHRQVEDLLRLPSAIRSRNDYVAWLGRFLGLYEPLERSLAAFPEWEALGFAPRQLSHSLCLVIDLAALGVGPAGVPRPARTLLPDLPTFAHALGSFYVLEGATLGGRVIIRDIETRLGGSIAEATRFFGGHGESIGPMWRRFRTRLDEFGHARPQLRDDVMAGAERAFCAFIAWFTPFCAAETAGP